MFFRCFFQVCASEFLTLLVNEAGEKQENDPLKPKSMQAIHIENSLKVLFIEVGVLLYRGRCATL